MSQQHYGQHRGKISRDLGYLDAHNYYSCHIPFICRNKYVSHILISAYEWGATAIQELQPTQETWITNYIIHYPYESVIHYDHRPISLLFTFDSFTR